MNPLSPFSVAVLAIWCTLSASTAAQTFFEVDPPVQQAPPASVGEAPTKPTRGFLSALVHNIGDDLKHVLSRSSVYWLVAGGVGALAIHPKDDDINRHLVGSSTADAFFKPGKYAGNTAVLLGVAGSSYVLGRAKNSPHAEHLGMDEIEAIALAEGIGHAVKFAVRRNRPIDIVTGEQRKGYSFPSGHATVTFSVATVLQRHLGNKAGIPTYLFGLYVAMSRLHDNRHHPSDVVFGAALGVVIGRAVTFHGRNFWGGPTVVPTSGGLAVVFTKPLTGS